MAMVVDFLGMLGASVAVLARYVASVIASWLAFKILKIVITRWVRKNLA